MSNENMSLNGFKQTELSVTLVIQKDGTDDLWNTYDFSATLKVENNLISFESIDRFLINFYELNAKLVNAVKEELFVSLCIENKSFSFDNMQYIDQWLFSGKLDKEFNANKIVLMNIINSRPTKQHLEYDFTLKTIKDAGAIETRLKDVKNIMAIKNDDWWDCRLENSDN